MAETGTSGDDKGKAGRGGMMPTIAAVTILTLLAGACGAGLGLLIGKPGPAMASAEPPSMSEMTDQAEAAEEHGAEGTGTPEKSAAIGKAKPGEPSYTMVDLAPVLTNIYAPQGTWLRVEAKLVIKNEPDADTELLAAQVGADTLAFLRSVQLSQIEGTRGLMHLRDDLRERAKMRSPAIVDYLIQSLVAE